jgi:hypothetical protein
VKNRGKKVKISVELKRGVETERKSRYYRKNTIVKNSMKE